MDHDPYRNQIDDQPTDRDNVHQRQVIKIVMAIVLVWLTWASTSTAGSPTAAGLPGEPCCSRLAIPVVDRQLQLDAFTPLSPGQPLTIAEQEFRAGSAELFAAPANFDADAAPDGWRAAVVIRNRNDEPILVPAQATFQIRPLVLRRPRYGIDRHSIRNTARQFVPALRWTRRLQFDDRGVASVQLPVRASLRDRLDWDRGGSTNWPIRDVESYRRFDGRRIDRLRGSPYHRHFVTQDLYDRIDYPTTSWLQVKVSIPGQPTLHAVAPVDLRPQVLVDTPYRYR